jgi:putative toxin-antitoxin system antitoxin component (TIGR02293 family)
MTARIAPNIEARPRRPAVSLVEWARVINTLAARTGRAQRGNINAPRISAKPAQAGALILTNGDRVADGAQHGTRSSGTYGYRMAPEVAEHLVVEGLDPDFLGEFAAISGLESRDVLDFAGIDRTTVSRRKASGSALPQDAAVKALQVTDLMTRATEVFGSPTQASKWLTKPHPSLDGDTPLRRARTPWGMSKVQSILVALCYGGAA